MLVMVDDYSKFCILCLLDELDSNAVWDAFVSRVLCHYGKPYRVRVDSGPEFAGAFAAGVKALGITLVKTAVHSPWTNGVAERMVRFVKGLVRKATLGSEKDQWPQVIPWV